MGHYFGMSILHAKGYDIRPLVQKSISRFVSLCKSPLNVSSTMCDQICVVHLVSYYRYSNDDLHSHYFNLFYYYFISAFCTANASIQGLFSRTTEVLKFFEKSGLEWEVVGG